MRMRRSESRATPTVAHHALLAYKPSLIATLPIRPSAERIMRFLVHAWRIDSHRAALESMRAERTGPPLSEANLPGVRQHALQCARLAKRSPHAKREIIPPNLRATGPRCPKPGAVHPTAQ